MTRYDLCLTWSWKYDADFVRLLDTAFRARRLSLLQVTLENVEAILPQLASGQVSFSAHFEFSAHDPRFEPVSRWAREHNLYRINPPELGDWAEDKATMHLELISAGVYTPYTIILPPLNEQVDLPPLDLSPFAGRFVIKPSYGGGGDGVILGASSLDQVQQARCQFPELKYLLQEQIEPRNLDGRGGWFRLIYCAGQHYPCWWDTHTHVYAPVSEAEIARYGLAPLREITTHIAQICKLEFFSTEIAYTPDGRWVVVDYVNDQIDLRPQSTAVDGVPDAILLDLAADLAGLVARHAPRPWYARLFG
jgi:glutathione synthase/RimK-type ligase-like ATP-grasp enzyme